MARGKIFIDDDYLERLVEVGESLTLEDTAFCLGVSKDTLRRHLQKNYGHDFAMIKRKRKIDRGTTIKKKLMELVDRGNLGAIIFALKNYEKWSDNVQKEESFEQEEELSHEE